MTKARNIIIIFVVNYALLVIVSGLIELSALSSKAKEVQNIMRTAADMSLDQSQVVGDFLNYNGGGSEDGRNYTLNMPRSNGNGFREIDLFSGLYGLNSNQPVHAEEIFNRLYTTQDFRSLSTQLGAIRKPVRYWNANKTGFVWYYIPTISLMGLDILPISESTRRVKDASGAYVSESLSNEIMSVYGLNHHKKMSGGKYYFNTPINLGITYVNEELLGALFMNNVDLLMRLKYETNLNTEAGGKGILKGETYSDKVEGDLNNLNPINNGSFSVLRGTKRGGDTSVESYNGVRPEVEYKVIDMYDRDNEDLLVAVFGGNKGGYNYKADYLKSLDDNIRNPVTNARYTQKPVVIAKVTFYMDVVVPYFTLIAREFRGSLGDGTSNFLEVLPESGDGAGGTRRIAYTRFFAVTP